VYIHNYPDDVCCFSIENDEKGWFEIYRRILAILVVKEERG